MTALSRAGVSVLKVALATGLSFVFFVLVSMLHSLFGVAFSQQTSEQKKRPVMAEMAAKKSPPEKKTAPQRVRQVASGSSGERAPAQSAMRFTPDLSIDAGGGGEGVELQQQELTAETFEEGQTDEPAQPVATPPVGYPERARELGVQGTVEVIFVVSHSGTVTAIDVVRSPHPSLTAEVKKAIAGWRFKPARNKGVPVNVRLRQVLDFRLE